MRVPSVIGSRRAVICVMSLLAAVVSPIRSADQTNSPLPTSNVSPKEDPMAILSAIDSFYARSFDRLQQLTIAMLVFLGGVVPLLITILQRRQFKLESKVVLHSIEERIRTLTQSLIDTIDAKSKETDEKLEAKVNKAMSDLNERLRELTASYEKRLSSTEESLQKRIADVTGGVLYTQATSKLQNHEYGCALSSLVEAGVQHIKSDNDLLLTRTTVMIEECLLKAKKADFEADPQLGTALEALCEALKALPRPGPFTDFVFRSARALSEAQLRV